MLQADNKSNLMNSNCRTLSHVETTLIEYPKN